MGDAEGADDSESIFNSLIILYRDWQSDDECGHRPDMLQKQVSSLSDVIETAIYFM